MRRQRTTDSGSPHDETTTRYSGGFSRKKMAVSPASMYLSVEYQYRAGVSEYRDEPQLVTLVDKDRDDGLHDSYVARGFFLVRVTA